MARNLKDIKFTIRFDDEGFPFWEVESDRYDVHKDFLYLRTVFFKTMIGIIEKYLIYSLSDDLITGKFEKREIIKNESSD